MTTQTTQHDTTTGRTSTRSGSGRTATRSSTSRRSGTRDSSGSADSSSRERSRSRAAGSTDGRRRQTAAGRGPGTASGEGNGVTARGRAAGRDGVPAGNPKAAAEHANRRNSVKFQIPLMGTVSLPATDELAFLGGVGVLAVAGIIEWPVALVLGAGHALVAMHRGKALLEFGEALEEA